MVYDLQKADIWKRIAAWLLDFMLATVLVVGCSVLLSSLLNYDSYSQSWSAACERYEAKYGIVFDITKEAYDGFSDEEMTNYDAAYQELIADEEAVYAYNMMVNLTMLIATLSILITIALLEFVVPLLFKNGQTLGKKMFSLCVVRKDCVKVNNLQMFTRAILGKFTIETMIPAYIIMMLFLGTANILGLAIIAGLFIGQCICLAVTRNNSAIHDLMAGTVVVDMPSQMIFDTEQDLIDYQKKIHAEQAARQDY